MDFDVNPEFYKNAYTRIFNQLGFDYTRPRFVEFYNEESPYFINALNGPCNFPVYPTMTENSGDGHSFKEEHGPVAHSYLLNNASLVRLSDIDPSLAIQHIESIRSQLQMLSLFMRPSLNAIWRHIIDFSAATDTYSSYFYNFDIYSPVQAHVRLYPYSKDEMIDRISRDFGVVYGYNMSSTSFTVENNFVRTAFWYGLASLFGLPLSTKQFDKVLMDSDSVEAEAMINRIELNPENIWDNYNKPIPFSSIKNHIDLLALFIPTIRDYVTYIVNYLIACGSLVDAGWCMAVSMGQTPWDAGNYNSFSLSSYSKQVAGLWGYTSIEEEHAKVLSLPVERTASVKEAIGTMNKFADWSKVLDFVIVNADLTLERAIVDYRNAEITNLKEKEINIPEPRLIEYTNNYSW